MGQPAHDAGVVPCPIAHFEVWLEVQDTTTSSGRRYVVYGDVRRFSSRRKAERCARAHGGLVVDLKTGEVYQPIRESEVDADEEA